MYDGLSIISDSANPATPLLDRPLFGSGSTGNGLWERYGNGFLVLVTCVMVLATTISAFVPGVYSSHVFFIICIILICFSHLTMIMWYRIGNLDPKFKMLIYFNAVSLIMLCICANIFFH